MKSSEIEQKTIILQMPVIYIVRVTRFLLTSWEVNLLSITLYLTGKMCFLFQKIYILIKEAGDNYTIQKLFMNINFYFALPSLKKTT